MQAGAGLLLRVVREAWERQQSDPVVGLVIAEPGPDRILEVDLGPDEDGVEVDHLLEPVVLRLKWWNFGWLTVVRSVISVLLGSGVES